jgi:uncharacterized membrane protein
MEEKDPLPPQQSLQNHIFEPVMKAVGFILPAFCAVFFGYVIYSWAEKWVLLIKPFLGPRVNALPFPWLVNPVLTATMLVLVTAALWVMGKLLAHQVFDGVLYSLRGLIEAIPVLKVVFRFLQGFLNQLLTQGPNALKTGRPGAVSDQFGREDYGLIMHRFRTESGEDRVIFYQIKSLNPIDGFTYSVPSWRVRELKPGSAEDIIQMTSSIGIVRSDRIDEFLRSYQTPSKAKLGDGQIPTP